MSLLALYWQFFFIGLITIGGGQVGITIMYNYIVEKGLLDSVTFYNMVAISESTPGPIGVNMATYIGYKMYGVGGGIITTLGTVTPSIIIIICIAKFFSKFSDTLIVQNLFKGIRPVVTGLILVAAWQVFRISVLNFDMLSETHGMSSFISAGLWDSFQILFNLPCFLCFLIMLFAMLRTKIPPLAYIVAGAVFGIVVL
ncbi:MAG: chromate transporter [Treponema sp. CETP13]|nr:MAG: chromate transporter [Treponema sp. CETP13]